MTAEFPTLADVVAARDGKDGQLFRVAEILNEVNEIQSDIPMFETNRLDTHEYSVRTGIPKPDYRAYNEYLEPKKATQTTLTDGVAMIEGFMEVDKALAELGGDPNGYRMKQLRAYVEGFGQFLARDIFYGDPAVNPKAFRGLNSRYKGTGSTNTVASLEHKDQFIDGDGTGSALRSIWLAQWSDMTIHGLYPQNSSAGLEFRNLPEAVSENDPANPNDTGRRMLVLRSHLKQHFGLAVPDWRAVVRIANLDPAKLKPSNFYFNGGRFFEKGSTTATITNLPDLLFEARKRLAQGRALQSNSVKTCIYMTPDMETVLNQQLSQATMQSVLKREEVGGRMEDTFQGIVIRRVDQMNVDEPHIAGI